MNSNRKPSVVVMIGKASLAPPLAKCKAGEDLS